MRIFYHDRVILRYTMRCGFIWCYAKPGGFQEMYPGQADSERPESRHAQRMQRALPVLVEPGAEPLMKTVSTGVNVGFLV